MVLYINDIPVDEGRYPKIDGVNYLFSSGALGLRVLGGTAEFRNLEIRDGKEKKVADGYVNPVNAGAGCADPVVLKEGGKYYAYCTYSPDFPRMTIFTTCITALPLPWTENRYILFITGTVGKGRTEPRQMSVDRIQFVEQAQGPDILEVWGPTSSPQPLPNDGFSQLHFFGRDRGPRSACGSLLFGH